MAVVNSKDSCSCCIYFQHGENDFIGSCRRFPLYQNRHSSEWCGEFAIVPPNPVFQALVQDIEITTEMAEKMVESAKEKRKKVIEEAGKVEPKPKGRPKKVDL